MVVAALPRSLVVNFNSPELGELARSLCERDALQAYVRPYANKGRAWERALSALPLAGPVYSSTFGRRRLPDPSLAPLTHEAGIAPDMVAAAVLRMRSLTPQTRQHWSTRLYMSVRERVAQAACRHVSQVECVVAYEGYALPAFDLAKRLRSRSTVLNYPVAHHRQRRRVRLEEIEREPGFAATWPDFDDWPAGHEERLDAEIEQADAILVGSTYAADSFAAEGIARSKMHVVPYGVDLRTFTPTAAETVRRDRPFEVIYAGQLTQRKGLSYLLQGYRQFARADSRLTLVGRVVGSEAPLKPYAPFITVVEHQTRAALAERYRQADVFVLPTLIEGMPLVVLEAMACGLPVIVTANGPADLVRDGIDGFVIPERDADAICDRLDCLYRDPERRREMGHQAARRALAFDWARYAGQAQRVLNQLGSGPDAHGCRATLA